MVMLLIVQVKTESEGSKYLTNLARMVRMRKNGQVLAYGDTCTSFYFMCILISLGEKHEKFSLINKNGTTSTANILK